MIWLRVELIFARERGKMCASVLKTKSSMSSRRSSSSENNRKRYLNVSARTYESILGGWRNSLSMALLFGGGGLLL